ncbi:hypothetical protein BKA70DRAFT_68453 [Coprinopsis sp. MPI-PUGE-AT-0042]|nr:hypothetical protein BKA70DRAFT_68453 [Coprinopsis sp. MPI-PUGE-AT-0042]
MVKGGKQQNQCRKAYRSVSDICHKKKATALSFTPHCINMEQGYPIDVIQSYELYQHIKYMNLASLCILICEWFNTLEVEAEVIWDAKWGFGSVIYTFSRLWPFFDVPLAIFCESRVSV